MKLSAYNTVISLQNKHLLVFNAYSLKYVIIKDCKPDLNTLEDILRFGHEKIYEHLISSGILIPDDVDELKLIKQTINRVDQNNDEFILHINPTLNCNFRCWYCYENHLPFSKMTQDTIESIKKFITLTLHGKLGLEIFQLCFFGGEPLLYYDQVCKQIIEYTSDLCNNLNIGLTVQFTSNGFLLNERMINELSRYRCSFQITLDGHRNHHDRTRHTSNGKGSYDKILSNIKFLLKYDLHVTLRINYTDANVDSLSDILSDLVSIRNMETQNLIVDFQRVWQDKKSRHDNTENKIGYLRDSYRLHGFDVADEYISNNMIKSCYGDKSNYCLINYNGDVFGCTARDFNSDNKIGVLNANGSISYDINKTTKRNNAKLTKKICQCCRIAPLCAGGCKQRAIEDEDESKCTFEFSENDKDEIVLSIIANTLPDESPSPIVL